MWDDVTASLSFDRAIVANGGVWTIYADADHDAPASPAAKPAAVPPAVTVQRGAGLSLTEVAYMAKHSNVARIEAAGAPHSEPEASNGPSLGVAAVGAEVA
ncbi:MAG TPA: hypothetical protein VFQ88_02875 [Nevskiaceae bacterium]|nr:hypothetical protein [Nevskiaceae bacterium]